MSRSVSLKAALEAYKAQSGESYRSIAMRAGIPVRSLMGVLEGHAPSIDRAAEVCEAIGLELYIGPPRDTGDQQPSRLASDTGDDRVRGRRITLDVTGPSVTLSVSGVPHAALSEDHRLTDIIQVLVDEFDALNEHGRTTLAARFWGLFPDLRERSDTAQNSHE